MYIVNISMEMLANKQNTGKYSNIRDIYHIVDIVKYKEQQIKEQSMSIEKNWQGYQHNFWCSWLYAECKLLHFRHIARHP